MKFKGFSVDGKVINIHLDNIILRFEGVEELERITEDMKESVKEIKAG